MFESSLWSGLLSQVLWTLDLDICLGTLASNLASHLESESIQKGCHILFPDDFPALCLGTREHSFRLLLWASPYLKYPVFLCHLGYDFFRDLAILSVSSASPEQSPEPPPQSCSSICQSTAFTTLLLSSLVPRNQSQSPLIPLNSSTAHLVRDESGQTHRLPFSL